MVSLAYTWLLAPGEQLARVCVQGHPSAVELTSASRQGWLGKHPASSAPTGGMLPWRALAQSLRGPGATAPGYPRGDVTPAGDFPPPPSLPHWAS